MKNNYYLWLAVRDMSVVFTLICQAINTLTDSADIASSPFLAPCTALWKSICWAISFLNVTGSSVELAKWKTVQKFPL